MEIMLVPPVIDRHVGILGNLDLWQRRMMDRLLVKPGDTLLDTGCGRGRIAFNVASWSNASVVGVNIDESQVAIARSLARKAGMEAQLQFVEQDYNDPFPFLANASLDGHYCAQACMFVNDKRKFMAESARVLKQGSRFYGLEWVQLPVFDAQNATQVDLVQRSATILGTSMPGPISAWTDAFAANGFQVIYAGHPTPHNSLALLEVINAVYAPLQGVVTLLGHTGLVSQRLVHLFERLRINWDALVTMMRLELATPTYEFVAEKL
jgi:sterol 24-C-methyltransferase